MGKVTTLSSSLQESEYGASPGALLHPFVEAVVENDDDADALLEADGAILDSVPAETDPERPKERFIPATRFSGAGFRVSLSQYNRYSDSLWHRQWR